MHARGHWGLSFFFFFSLRPFWKYFHHSPATTGFFPTGLSHKNCHNRLKRLFRQLSDCRLLYGSVRPTGCLQRTTKISCHRELLIWKVWQMLCSFAICLLKVAQFLFDLASVRSQVPTLVRNAKCVAPVKGDDYFLCCYWHPQASLFFCF